MGAENEATLMDMIEMLPEELGEEILARLPVKSLLRFGSVSKACHNFVSKACCNPCFRHNHSSNLRHKKHDVPAMFMFRSFGYIKPGEGRTNTNRDETLNIYTYTNNENTNENIVVSRPLDLPLYYEYIAVSCDGILCPFSRLHNTIRLSNPFTKRFVLLTPSSSIFFANHPGSFVDYLGFGYDASTNDYKVVRRWYSAGKDVAEHAVEVYKLSTNAWTLVESTDPLTAGSHNRRKPYGVHVKGFCYWWDISVLKGILSFDFKSEKFGKIECPKEVIDIMLSHLYSIMNREFLGVLDDSLALYVFIQFACSSMFAYVWVKKSKKDDPQESAGFMKKLRVEFTANVTRSRHYHNKILNFSVVRDGNVTTLLLLWNNGQLTEVQVGKDIIGWVEAADSRSRMVVQSEFSFFGQSVPFQPSFIHLPDLMEETNKDIQINHGSIGL